MVVVARETRTHVSRTLERLGHEEMHWIQAFDRCSFEENIDGMSQASRALDVIRERRRVLLMVPRPGARKGEERPALEVRPAEVLDVVPSGGLDSNVDSISAEHQQSLGIDAQSK